MTVSCLGPARGAMFLVTALIVLAQARLAQADCLVAGSRLSPEQLSKLQGDPASLFLNGQGSTLGNAELISKTRELVTSDKTALKLITEALKLASAEEKSAIGTALGQAAQACLIFDAGYSAEIQETLAASTDQSAILAFSAVTGNVPTGATGGSGAAGGGAGGAAGGGGGGSSTGSVASTGTNTSVTGGGAGTPPGATISAASILTTTTTTITVITPTTGITATNATTSVSP